MNALVQRGARDLLDVATIIELALVTPSQLWALWRRKRPDLTVALAQANILKYLNALGSRRPLESISDFSERQLAENNRRIVRL